jgi:hypothetical protein
LGFSPRVSSKGVVRLAMEAPLDNGTKNCDKMALAFVPASR